MSKITPPANFKTERRLELSNAVMRQCLRATSYINGTYDLDEWDSHEFVRVQKMTEVGVQSQYGAKEKDIEPNANIQTVESAFLSPLCDTLTLTFTITVLPLKSAGTTTDVEWRAGLENLLQAAKDRGAVRLLAQRYAHTIVSAKWLWRNLDTAEHVLVSVHDRTGSLYHGDVEYFADPFPANRDVSALAAAIECGLTTEPVKLTVRCAAYMGAGAQVFPSQLFAQKEKGQGGTNKRLLGTWVRQNGEEPFRAATLRSAKISNQIRRIDTFYGEEEMPPIPVEPYGQDRATFIVHRMPRTKKDFYTLIWTGVKTLSKLEDKDLAFVTAVLVRGGVFSGKAEKDGGGDA